MPCGRAKRKIGRQMDTCQLPRCRMQDVGHCISRHLDWWILEKIAIIYPFNIHLYAFIKLKKSDILELILFYW
jgi:hypothetical protein